MPSQVTYFISVLSFYLRLCSWSPPTLFFSPLPSLSFQKMSSLEDDAYPPLTCRELNHPALLPQDIPSYWEQGALFQRASTWGSC